MYRPTVRYAEIYKTYIEEVFHATTLDRNQIIRLALFVAANSPEYNAILSEYKYADVLLPRPKWSPNQSALWQSQEPTEMEEGGTSHVIDGREASFSEVVDVSRAGAAGATTQGENTRREGSIREGVIKATGGSISFALN
ncbi:hypothetical protein [Rossellomorea aquimaris]|uniref:hypothetical protein n=1 Tax=Rossellomorea aquimaris TaxID=189382 RepID=UPI0011E8C38E|nr:hypothetical protein [Rossellomorea aquimaris]TYS88981.1 hypothetical protein FZC88_13020 [Rossellomorea aquimaris]